MAPFTKLPGPVPAGFRITTTPGGGSHVSPILLMRKQAQREGGVCSRSPSYGLGSWDKGKEAGGFTAYDSWPPLGASHASELCDMLPRPLVSGNFRARPLTPAFSPTWEWLPGRFAGGLQVLAQLEGMCLAPLGGGVLGTLGGTRSYQVHNHFRGTRTSFLKPDSKGFKVKGLRSSFMP